MHKLYWTICEAFGLNTINSCMSLFMKSVLRTNAVRWFTQDVSEMDGARCLSGYDKFLEPVPHKRDECTCASGHHDSKAMAQADFKPCTEPWTLLDKKPISDLTQLFTIFAFARAGQYMDEEQISHLLPWDDPTDFLIDWISRVNDSVYNLVGLMDLMKSEALILAPGGRSPETQDRFAIHCLGPDMRSYFQELVNLWRGNADDFQGVLTDHEYAELLTAARNIDAEHSMRFNVTQEKVTEEYENYNGPDKHMMLGTMRSLRNIADLAPNVPWHLMHYADESLVDENTSTITVQYWILLWMAKIAYHARRETPGDPQRALAKRLWPLLNILRSRIPVRSPWVYFCLPFYMTDKVVQDRTERVREGIAFPQVPFSAEELKATEQKQMASGIRSLRLQNKLAMELLEQNGIMNSKQFLSNHLKPADGDARLRLFAQLSRALQTRSKKRFRRWHKAEPQRLKPPVEPVEVEQVAQGMPSLMAVPDEHLVGVGPHAGPGQGYSAHPPPNAMDTTESSVTAQLSAESLSERSTKAICRPTARHTTRIDRRRDSNTVRCG